MYDSAEKIFRQLQKLVKDHSQWVVLGTVDLQEFVESRLKETAEWKANFAALKKKRKESERLPDSVKVGCFTISFASFKGMFLRLLARQKVCLFKEKI